MTQLLIMHAMSAADLWVPLHKSIFHFSWLSRFEKETFFFQLKKSSKQVSSILLYLSSSSIMTIMID